MGLWVENTILKVLALLGVLVYVGWKAYLFGQGNYELGDALSSTRELVMNMLRPSFIVATYLRYLLFSYLCIAASSDLCMYLIFEIMDDDIKVRKKGEDRDEAQDDLFGDWNDLVGKPPPD